MTISRFVTLLTPVFAALSGWVCQLAVKYLPGAPHLDQGQLTALFIVGATSATAASVKWLHGRSLAERQAVDIERLKATLPAAIDPTPVLPDPKPKPRSRARKPVAKS